jgi:hypothetical protein
MTLLNEACLHSVARSIISAPWIEVGSDHNCETQWTWVSEPREIEFRERLRDMWGCDCVIRSGRTRPALVLLYQPDLQGVHKVQHPYLADFNTAGLRHGEFKKKEPYLVSIQPTASTR